MDSFTIDGYISVLMYSVLAPVLFFLAVYGFVIVLDYAISFLKGLLK